MEYQARSPPPVPSVLPEAVGMYMPAQPEESLPFSDPEACPQALLPAAFLSHSTAHLSCPVFSFLHSSPSLRDVQNIKSLISPLLGDVVINQV